MNPPRRQLSSPGAIELSGDGQDCSSAGGHLARILLVDESHVLEEAHVVLLRSIPASVESLCSCADMYLHKGHDYALVILVLHPESRETAEAAFFVRHRWSRARILLLESQSAIIDDWLYDERIDPCLHPVTVRGAAIRLMTGREWRTSA